MAPRFPPPTLHPPARPRAKLPAAELLPLLFRLFKVQNKALRTLVFRHITADIKAANKKARNERLNRSLQAFMYSVLGDPHEGTAKRGLAVLTELWRRRIWRDARTVNVIASAAAHPSPRILLAVLKFFIGQDAGTGGGADSDDSDDEGDAGAEDGPAAPSKDAIYAAYHKGTSASKKKKQRKLKRVQAAVKKAERRGGGLASESFAALQLLHDPQGFADRLFQRMQAPGTRHETRLVIMSVLSRAIGVHKLLVLNFYPLLQKYIAPQTPDVTAVLAAFVQACHDQVPPDALEPALRRLVDQFVHDRARPEVMTIGLKTVREICTRTPLIMTPDLLQVRRTRPAGPGCGELQGHREGTVAPRCIPRAALQRGRLGWAAALRCPPDPHPEPPHHASPTPTGPDHVQEDAGQGGVVRGAGPDFSVPGTGTRDAGAQGAGQGRRPGRRAATVRRRQAGHGRGRAGLAGSCRAGGAV